MAGLSMDINKIKPKIKGTSDKYSWQLYRFLNTLYKDKNEGKYVRNQLKIYWNTKSRWDSSYVSHLDKDHLVINQMFLSPLGGKVVGYFMSDVMSDRRKEQFWIEPYSSHMVDITDWFWKEYEARGRCLLHGHGYQWLVGDEDRYTQVNNTRRCNWCGQWQRKEVEKEVKITYREKWYKE